MNVLMYKLILWKGVKYKMIGLMFYYKIMIIFLLSKMILWLILNMCILIVVNEINVLDCFEFFEKFVVEKENCEGNRNDLF